MNKKRVHKNKTDFRCADYYNYYKRKVEAFPELHVTQALHTKILDTFARVIIRKIVNEMFKFRIPGLGCFYLKKVKIKIRETEDGDIQSTAPVNWAETNKVRALTGDETKRVVFLNDHTNGYVYRVRWYKTTSIFVNKEFYSFILATKARKYISNCIRENVKPLNAYAV
jgi:hypothetical protein